VTGRRKELYVNRPWRNAVQHDATRSDVTTREVERTTDQALDPVHSSKLGLRVVRVRVVELGSANEVISAIAERLERLTACTTDVDCGAGWLVDAGHPADRLVAAAADEQASLIVVGSTGGRTSLHGSVSAEVARRALCPVVVVAPVLIGA
jgi:nucleotide-binding universal stress UspA family protein